MPVVTNGRHQRWPGTGSEMDQPAPQEAEGSWVTELQEELEQEISELEKHGVSAKLLSSLPSQ